MEPESISAACPCCAAWVEAEYDEGIDEWWAMCPVCGEHFEVIGGWGTG